MQTVLGRVAPAVWIDECERANELTEPLSIHTVRMLPEFTMTDMAVAQAEDTEIGPAYRILLEDTEPTPEQLRTLPLESRLLVSDRPQVCLVDNVMVRVNPRCVDR